MRTSLLLGFIALLVLIGANLVLTNRTIGDLQAVRLELEALLRACVDAETGQRGFTVAGDGKFLEPHNAARQRLAVLALTAFAREADRKAAIIAGFDEHLAKTVDTASLLRTVAKVIGCT